MTLEELKQQCPGNFESCTYGSCKCFEKCVYQMLLAGDIKSLTTKKQVPYYKTPKTWGCFLNACTHDRTCELQAKCIYYHIDFQSPEAQKELANNRSVRKVLKLFLKYSKRGIKFLKDSPEERERIWAARNGYS